MMMVILIEKMKRRAVVDGNDDGDDGGYDDGDNEGCDDGDDNYWLDVMPVIEKGKNDA